MARTAAQVLASARYTLNDPAGDRAADAELLGYVVDALNTIKNERPDLFVGSWGEIETIASGDNLPLPGQFFRPIVDYVIARADSKDADHVVSARVELMAKLAGGFLT